jgi:pimeloyl-ACP methyl ester carboxylesterase
VILLRHSKVNLAVHELRDGTGRPLLILHGLGERIPVTAPSWTAEWPGPVVGLDFTGHGSSTVPTGGGYTAEVLMGDADVALAHIGPATVAGRGLGAYIALLIAGARPRLVRGAVLSDGPGLAGGPVGPSSTGVAAVDLGAPTPPDPWALVELSRDVRPGDYAANFARQALTLSGLRDPIALCVRARASWVDAVRDELGVIEVSSLEEGIGRFVDVE